jgi:hypothetical protein
VLARAGRLSALVARRLSQRRNAGREGQRGPVTDASRWRLEPEGEGTRVILEWNPRVEKPLVKILSPILKPIFRWNHDWTMKLGERRIAAYLGGSFERN